MKIWSVVSTNIRRLIDGENFRFVSFLNTKLWSSKLDVCGRPLFANPVTYIDQDTSVASVIRALYYYGPRNGGVLLYTVHALLAPQCVKLITKLLYIHDHFEDQVINSCTYS